MSVAAVPVVAPLLFILNLTNTVLAELADFIRDLDQLQNVVLWMISDSYELSGRQSLRISNIA